MNSVASEKGIQMFHEGLSPVHNTTEMSSTVSVDNMTDKKGLKRKHPYIPKKKYAIITKELRERFISRVLSKQVSIKEAAEEFGIKFSTSKAILQTFRREGRIGKKKTRERRKKPYENEELNKKFKKILEAEAAATNQNVVVGNAGLMAAMNTELNGQEVVSKLSALPKQVLEQVPSLLPNIQQLNCYLKAAELLHGMIKLQQEEIQKSIINFAQSKVSAQVSPPPMLPPVLPNFIGVKQGY